MSTEAPARIGILGFGRIGRVVAANLQAGGFSVATVERPSSRNFPSAGGRLEANAARLAAASDVVVSCLASEAQMEQAFLGFDGLMAGAHNSLVVIEMGTFPIALKQRISEALAPLGAAMLDCPISRTPPVVARREAMLFVSGDEAIVHRMSPVLTAISQKQTYVGAFGAGTA